MGISKLNVEPCVEMTERRKKLGKRGNEKVTKKSTKKKTFLSDKIDANLVDSDDEIEKRDENLERGKDLEQIADSGRLFIRNLSYLCTENDLKNLFETYGTLTELILPVDDTTQRPKGLFS